MRSRSADPGHRRSAGCVRRKVSDCGELRSGGLCDPRGAVLSATGDGQETVRSSPDYRGSLSLGRTDSTSTLRFGLPP